MKIWIKLLVVAAAMLGVVLADEAKDQACDFHARGRTSKFEIAFSSLVDTCFNAIAPLEMVQELENANSLEDYRRFSSGFCTHAPQFASCVATLKASYETCHNKNVSVPVMIMADAYEHLLPVACENDGDRIAYLLHVWTIFQYSESSTIAFSTCLAKSNLLVFQKSTDMDLDIVSQTYITYKDITKITGCMRHLEDEAYRQAGEVLGNELISTLKCQHPEEDRLVLCKDIDVSKVPTTNICDTKPLNMPNLYDHLEKEAIACTGGKLFLTSHIMPNTSSVSLEELKEEYNTTCNNLINLPYCLVVHTAIAEDCLNQEEEKQFQLFAQAIQDMIQRSCVEEGATMASVMQEVYHQTPEHVNTLRECYNEEHDGTETHHGHAVSKNMRFYHEMIAFKQCAVAKLHTNSELSKSMENMMNEVLKNMKCVNPEDGTAVLCETIHTE